MVSKLTLRQQDDMKISKFQNYVIGSFHVKETNISVKIVVLYPYPKD